MFNGINGVEYSDALFDIGMPDKQAEIFTQTYEVTDQHTDAETGFSATLFRNKRTGKYTLATRGTELPGDTFADVFFNKKQRKSRGSGLDT